MHYKQRYVTIKYPSEINTNMLIYICVIEETFVPTISGISMNETLSNTFVYEKSMRSKKDQS